MTKKFICLAISLTLLSGAVCAAGSTETAIHHFRQHAFSQSQTEFAEAAQAGDANAQYLLGIGLLQGKYFPKNEMEGFKAHPPRRGDYTLSGNDIRDALLFMSKPPGS